MSQFPIPAPSDFQRLIPTYVQEARAMASTIFGPADERWTYRGHYSQPQQGPMMSPKFDEMTFGIRLSERAMSDWWACVHEIGHEALHSLAPVSLEDDTHLEEGAACIMAVRYRHAVTGNLVSGPTKGVYAEPYRLVTALVDADPGIIMRCRLDSRRFRDISPADLRAEGATLSDAELAFLC